MKWFFLLFLLLVVFSQRSAPQIQLCRSSLFSSLQAVAKCYLFLIFFFILCGRRREICLKFVLKHLVDPLRHPRSLPQLSPLEVSHSLFRAAAFLDP